LCSSFGACGIDECDYCKDYNFSEMVAHVVEVPEPACLGTYVENPEEYVEDFSCDVLVAVNLHPDILIDIPKIVDCKALIVPACNQNWCRPGLRKQLLDICSESGIEFDSPKPFCSFSPSTPILRRFSDELNMGKPEFEVEIEGSRVRKVRILKSDPCGSAYFVARRMTGYIIQSPEEFWKEIHQLQCSYPCLASMERDPELIEAPFHLAGYIMVYQFSKAAEIDALHFVPEYLRKFVEP
jgi:hypothetical protein